MAIKYQRNDFKPEALSIHNIDRMAVEEVPNGSLVLDVGCATGFMGKYLCKKKNCKVIGVDIRKEEIAEAKKNLDKALQADIGEEKSVNRIMKLTAGRKFDVILATSLIEHTADPQKIINIFKRMLKNNGLLILTTPNIAHWTIRLNLLAGRFNYTKYGIMDETHMHFFTMDSFKKLFDDAGFNIKRVRIDAEGGGLPRISLILSKMFPNVFAYQMLITASK